MAEEDVRPRCPKCGQPAREVVGMARVRAELGLDGEPGRVRWATRLAADAAYICGGGHEWNLIETSGGLVKP